MRWRDRAESRSTRNQADDNNILRHFSRTTTNNTRISCRLLKSPTKSPSKKRPAATPPAATKTEAEARTFYYYLFAKRCGIRRRIAILLYAFSAHLIPASPVATKLQFMHTYSLGFVYAAWYILYITRLACGPQCQWSARSNGD